ncbi:MAG: hypothetical protein K2L67_05260 [Clostridia bacterium]|nr:hypothetical protein [Clostridia bacterium]
MSKRTRFKLLILAAALCVTAALFAGCSGELKVNDFLGQNNALNQQVTYYGNGGYFNNTNNIVEKNIYYHVDDYVITDFSNINGISLARENYVFLGWYHTELTDKIDGEGNVVYDTEGKPVQVPVFETIEVIINDKATEVKVAKIDENRPLEAGLKMPANTHYYVGAKWAQDVQLQYVLASDDPITVKVDGVDTVKNKGDVIAYKNFYNNSTTIEDKAPVASSDSTFLQCFLDADCKIPAAGITINKPDFDDEDAQQKATVYVKYIKGIYTVVRTEADVRKMFNSLQDETSFYIFNDITCSGNGLQFNPKSSAGRTNCKIEGNGHTISNLRFEFVSASSIIMGETYSIFGKFGASAEIKNLTLNNVKASFNSNRNLGGLYFLCSGDDGATFENFEIKNAVLDVDVSGRVSNIQLINGVYQSNNWLVGGVANDADYNKFGNGKLTINGKKLIVKDEVVVDEPAKE